MKSGESQARKSNDRARLPARCGEPAFPSVLAPAPPRSTLEPYFTSEPYFTASDHELRSQAVDRTQLAFQILHERVAGKGRPCHAHAQLRRGVTTAVLMDLPGEPLEQFVKLSL